MNTEDNTRRNFIKKTMLSAAGLGLANTLPPVYGRGHFLTNTSAALPGQQLAKNSFIPNRVASWWTTIEDLQWPQKKITDKIKKRAAGFAAARIDTAVNFGFHIRFDFADYFGQLHGYYANVCEELHQHGIRFMEHYSCNHIARPKNDEELKKMNRFQRHHVLLYHDPIAAQYAQYEGHLFNDVCEVDLRDGSRGYATQYQLNTFCHNNPNYLDMHRKYLQRLIKEVPFDGIMVDDMCDYAGPTTCGCKYCRARFQKDYGHNIPPFGEVSFWGDTSGSMLLWGNYENPVFRNWLNMKTDCIVDHLKMIKDTLGQKPLMTCCSNTGPIILNALSLDLEKMSPQLDLFVLENVGTNVQNIDWVDMDAEALHQKDMAQKTGNAPAMALSYTIYERGAYFGWALSRFWGVSNWSSTLNYRLEEDPPDAMEMEDVISPSNNWEADHNDLHYMDGRDLVEVRLVNNGFCRQNGWRDKDGKEHWDRVKAWSKQLVEHSVGYRFVRANELSDEAALLKEKTPLILDGAGCISEKQFAAIKTYLAKGGTAWLSLPFGTHDEKGFIRKLPLSTELLKNRYKNLLMTDSAVSSKPLERFITEKKFYPIMKQVQGDKGWVARIRFYKEKPVIHFMNTALQAVAHPTLKDLSGIPILIDINSLIKDNRLIYELNTRDVNLVDASVMSPELGTLKTPLKLTKKNGDVAMLGVDLSGVKMYAVVQ